MGFNLFGIDVFPVAENNDFFLPPGEKQVAARVKISEIPCIKPSVAQHRGGGVCTVPVSLHNYRSAEGYFADGRSTFFLWLRICNFGFDPLQGFTYRADLIVMRRVCEDGS